MALSFRFALPELRRHTGTRYQARLVGLNDSFSDWGEATHYRYTRLEPGQYRFEARAQDALGQVVEMQPYVFVIGPRWYNSLWGRALLLAVFIVRGGLPW